MSNVILSPSAFIKPKEIEIPAGVSLNDISRLVYDDVGLPQICRESDMVIEVDGEYIPKAEWDYVPPESSRIQVYMPLRGGGKNPLRMILTAVLVVATIASGGAASPLLGLQAGSMAALAVNAAVTVAVSTAGMLLINAIAPVRPSGGKSGNPKDAQAYSISGSRNSLAPYQPVPVVLGTHRFFPPLAAKPYTELVGQDEYIRILLAWAGPCKIEDIKIGDTPIDEFPGFEAGGGSSIEIREGRSNDDPITLIPGIVNQTRVDVKLEQSAGWTNRTMAAGYDELSIEVSFPRGLIRYNKEGKKKPVTVVYAVRYREVGGTWQVLSAAQNFPYANRAISTMANGDWCLRALMNGDLELAQSGINRPGTIAIAYWKVLDGLIYELVNVPGTGKTGMIVQQSGAVMEISSGTLKFPDNDFTVTGTTTTLVRRAFYGKVDPSKSYEIGLSRVTADSDDDRITDEIFWTIFRGVRHTPPLKFSVPMAQIALRIKATEGAQNQIDVVNCLASSYAPRFIDDAWETEYTEVSNNPAALFRGVLMHPANKMPRTAAQIDDEMLGEWYVKCETEGYEFNQVREFVASVWDCLADIAFAGRGAPSLPYGKWSVDFDQAERVVKGHVTPRNSWGFKAEKQLINRPHAFKIIFNNEDKEYLEDERIVYDDGYTVENATVFERLEFKGITNADLAWKFGRYHIAQARLRPEIYTVYMDFEHLTFRRNDLLMVSHDVPRWGDHWGRVKSIVTSGSNTTGMVLDDEVVMVDGESYAVRIRLQDGSSLVLGVINTEDTTKTIGFSGSIPTIDGPQVDDLYMFNLSDQTAVELICLGIRRQHDMVAEVSFVDHAPEVYDADTGTIPPYDSNIGARLFPMYLSAPIIESARGEIYSEDFVSADLKYRIVVIGSVASESVALRNRDFVVRWRIVEEASPVSPWTEEIFTSNPVILNIPAEGVYQIEAKQRGVIQGIPGYYGQAESKWSDTATVEVFTVFDIGLPAPTNIQGFYELDSNGNVSQVKLRLNVDISQTVPTAVALMVSVQQEPRELGVVDEGDYLVVNDANILNSGTFTIKAGSTSSNVIVTSAGQPLPDYDLSGYFWGTLDGILFRKATGSDSTGIQFAQAFPTTPVPGQLLTWAELVWSDERVDDFKLMHLVDSGGNYEVAKWSSIDFISNEYRISVERAQEGTTERTATIAQYYPAPGAGTQTILIPASNFVELATNTFEGSADVQVVVPAGSWIAVTMATYVLQGLRVVRSPIVPITNWTRL